MVRIGRLHVTRWGLAWVLNHRAYPGLIPLILVALGTYAFALLAVMR